MNRKLAAIILGLSVLCSGCSSPTPSHHIFTATSVQTPVQPTIETEPAVTDMEATQTPDLRQEATAAATASPEWIIAGFPIVYQNPELPTGCEITSLTMMLNYYGYHVDKMTMATKYLPKTTIKTWEGTDGKTYGPDLYYYFAGDPGGIGITCGAGAIETAANSYLTAVGSTLHAQDITGTPVYELYEYIEQNTPVFVCATIDMNDRKVIQNSWYTPDGRLMDWSTNDHGMVLIGYTQDSVIIADPINGRANYSREQFERVYGQRQRQAVILQ